MASNRRVPKKRAFEQEFARFQKNFGMVVRQLRENARLSWAKLATKARFSVSTLVHIERGHGNPSLSRMENLAAALKH